MVLFSLWSDVEVLQVTPDLSDLIALGFAGLFFLDVRESGPQLVNPVACSLLAGLKSQSSEQAAKIIE